MFIREKKESLQRKCKKNRLFFADIRKSRIFAPLFRTMKAFGRLAQLVQSICLTSRGSAVRIRQRPQNLETSSDKKESRSHKFGRLAQLVQSICLTSRGSAVRIRQRPQRSSLIGGLLFFIYSYKLFDILLLLFFLIWAITHIFACVNFL